MWLGSHNVTDCYYHPALRAHLLTRRGILYELYELYKPYEQT